MANNHYLFSLHHQQQQLKYHQKSKRIKKIVKNMLFENTALRDQVAQIQETILAVKEERKFLLKKLMEFDSDIIIDLKPPLMSTDSTPPATATNNCGGPTTQSHPPPPPAPPTVRKKYKKRGKSTETAAGAPTANKNKSKSRATCEVDGTQTVEMAQPLSSPPAAAPLVTHTKQQITQTISVDQMGRPIYPIHMDSQFSVYDLGEIEVERPGYHNEHWIYPIGYVSTRIYGHMLEPDRKCTYTCKIIDGGEFPRFEIIPDSDMDYAIAGPSPDLCHAALLQTINSNSNARHIEVRPQGEWFFGLGHPTVMTLLQTTPSAADCQDFIGFKSDTFNMDMFNDPTINYDSLQIYLGKNTSATAASSVYHMVPEIKEEPPEDLFENVDIVTTTSTHTPSSSGSINYNLS